MRSMLLGVAAALGLIAATTRKAQAAEVPDVTNNLEDIFPSMRPESVNETVKQVLPVNKNLPRGIRNNNPGNLVITSIPWNGKIPVSKNTDGSYEQFSSALMGIRAMFIDMRGDIEKDGNNTIRKLITEYAPPHENNTAAYIAAVSQKLGLHADAAIQKSHYHALIKAVIQHENGQQPYADSLISEAMSLA